MKLDIQVIKFYFITFTNLELILIAATTAITL